ncbi:hypothetical protein Mal15_59890 [Stieleria maiorica]|uniref:Uncharacterized protein n=1 Tax=Stieleria maiorica TaxID=2795974 RepID=A0A5B9MS69_9BACT|nr:hypothetical protein [Stieleria maiorica]QEG01908.1 hypothetical protein Mal15_59890 [Stieleria maiorica]
MSVYHPSKLVIRCAWWLALSLIGPCAGVCDHPFNLQEIASTQTDRIESVESIEIRYSDQRWSLQKQNRGNPVVEAVHYIWTPRHSNLFRQSVAGSLHDHPLHPGMPIMREYGGVISKHWPSFRKLEYQLSDKQHQGLSVEYFEQLGVWPYPDRPATRPDYFFPSVLIVGQARLATATERVDGFECVVIDRETEGVDRIWLDPALGFMPRRRLMERSRVPTRQDSRMEVSFRDYRDIGSGLSLPFQIRSRQLRRLSEPAGEFGVIGEASVSVEEIQLNQVKATALSLPVLLPGTVVEHADSDRRHVVAGGERLLVEATERAIEVFDWPHAGGNRAGESAAETTGN